MKGCVLIAGILHGEHKQSVWLVVGRHSHCFIVGSLDVVRDTQGLIISWWHMSFNRHPAS